MKHCCDTFECSNLENELQHFHPNEPSLLASMSGQLSAASSDRLQSVKLKTMVKFHSVASIDSRAPKLVPYRHGLFMVLLQPLVPKNISLLIFEYFLFGNNFNSVAIIDSRAPKCFPYRLGLFMVLLRPCFEKYSSIYF